MSFATSLANGLLRSIAAFHPEYASTIATVIKYEPLLEKAGPVITNAIKQGGSALAAAEKAAPELAASIREFASAVPGIASSHADAPAAIEKNAENIMRHAVGHPSMTHDEEIAFANRATPHNDPSEENSRFGG